jgi:FkbM family methyltransferase
MIKFRSQVGQDAWVCEKLNYKTEGYFIDIGSADGKWFSNTYYLENELRWTGICVEAFTRRYRSLVKNRRCICVNKAVHNEDGYVNFAKSDGIFGVKENLQFGITKEIKRPYEAITMATLLDTYKSPELIDYISIDTEGNDYNVILGFPFDRYRARLWTIEHNAYADGGLLKEKIRRIMSDNGYKLVPNNAWASTFEDWFEL